MDLTPKIIEAFLSVWWVIPALLFIQFVKSSKAKGMIGEAFVKLSAKIRLSSKTYHRIHNVTLETPDGTTQIDHLFVSVYGIFVVETKNMKGWIFGSEKQAQWTQKIYKKSFKFQNPLRQNYKHVKALQTSFDIPLEAIHSVVVFAGDSTFKAAMPKNVTQGSAFVSYIKSFDREILSLEEVEDIVQRIQSDRLAPSRSTDRRHVEQLKARHGVRH